MNNSRRTFLTSTLAASAATALSTTSLRAAAAPAGREYYDLRAYRLKPGAPSGLDRYLEKALLPALDKRGHQDRWRVHRDRRQQERQTSVRSRTHRCGF